MPPARTQRCDVVARVYGRLSAPRKTSLNWTMPELVNSSVGSSAGTSDDDGTIVCPRSAKKCRNLVRMSAAFMAERSSVVSRREGRVPAGWQRYRFYAASPARAIRGADAARAVRVGVRCRSRPRAAWARGAGRTCCCSIRHRIGRSSGNGLYFGQILVRLVSRAALSHDSGVSCIFRSPLRDSCCSRPAPRTAYAVWSESPL